MMRLDKVSFRGFLIASCIFSAGLFLAAKAQAQLPNVNLKTTEGKTISAETLKNDGKPLVVSFWATWCKPCIDAIPHLNKLHEKHKDDGLTVIGGAAMLAASMRWLREAWA